MCQLLGMNCATPTDVTFSFTGFAKRGGVTDHHADGWGIAFFEDKACRLFIDHQSSASSPIAELVKRYPIKSKNTIAHIRKATQGRILLENCHPFQRELWGRHWIFAHNGDLQREPLGEVPAGAVVDDAIAAGTPTLAVQPTQFEPALSGTFAPVGTTDSEYAFCAILQGLRERFPDAQPALPELFEAIEVLTREISRHGVFNFLLSNGQALFAHCSTHLHYLVRQWPFSTAHLIDEDMTVDFANYTTPEDRVAVIATQPLTDNEVWTRLEPGELVMFQDGEVAARTVLPVPDAVRVKAAQSPCAAGTIRIHGMQGGVEAA
jgi:predicted glutamine amidotransferase